MCGLLPDPARHGDRLQIRSIIGEFLEHSRLYHFEYDGRSEWFAGSADLMDRNLDRRVEALFPLLDAESIRRCEEVLSVLLSDVRNSWVLQPDGAWVRREELARGEKGEETRSAFTEFKQLASDSAA
jgi:polyphosphate kinase